MAGNVSLASAALTVTLDTTAPLATSALTLDPDSDSGVPGDRITSVTLPTLTGTAEPGSTVSLYDGTTLIGTGTAAPSTGAWSITATTALTEGANSLTTTATDSSGNVSPVSAALTVNLDTTAPLATSALTLAPASDSGVPGDGLTNVRLPTLTGTAEPGSTIRLFDNGELIGTGTADPSTGAWSVTATTPLVEGGNSLIATATDRSGNVSPISTALSVTLDTTAPIAPTISSRALTNVAAPVLSGTAETGDTVTVSVGGATYTTVATASGWTLDLARATPASGTLALNTNGTNTVAASAVDSAGNAAPTTTSRTLTIDTTAPTAPTGPSLASASDSGALGDGITNVSTPTVIGTAQPGTTVNLYDTDGTFVLGTTVADETGNYRIVASSLSQGVHSITVKAMDAAGNLSTASSAFSLTLDTTALTPQILAVGSRSGAQTGFTNVAIPTLSGTAEAGSRITLYEGVTPLGTATVAQNGTWSFTAGTLAKGSHQITASVADQAGNISSLSSPFALNIDTIPPDVTAALLNDTGSSATDRITADATLTGNGDPNAVVTIGEGTTTLGTTLADAQGHWTFAPTGLALGVHTLLASETDAAGNTSTAQIGLRLDPQSAAASSDFITIRPTNVGIARFFDSVAGTQFYTSSLSEYNAILLNRPDLKQESNDLNALNPNTVATDHDAVPVYRFFDSTYGTHFFTASTGERDGVIAARPDLKFEGVGFFEHTIQQAGDTAVYRFFDSRNGTHFYTTNDTEKASILTMRPDLVSEGIGFYAPKIS